jgi:hypothetical protein
MSLTLTLVLTHIRLCPKPCWVSSFIKFTKWADCAGDICTTPCSNILSPSNFQTLPLRKGIFLSAMLLFPYFGWNWGTSIPFHFTSYHLTPRGSGMNCQKTFSSHTIHYWGNISNPKSLAPGRMTFIWYLKNQNFFFNLSQKGSELRDWWFLKTW